MKVDVGQNRYKQEENIKKRLQLIDFQESNNVQYRSNRLFEYTGTFKRKQSDEKDISDWTSSYIIKKQDIQLAKNPQQKSQNKRRFDFLNTTKYHSALLSNDDGKKQRTYMSPMVIKFNAKILSHNLQSAQQNFIKKLKEDLYLTHYKNKGVILERLCRDKRQKSPVHKKIDISDTFKSPQSPPKTQRISSILRLLKKRQPSRFKRDSYHQSFKAVTPYLRTTKIF